MLSQSSKLERLFSLKRGKRDFRALSFELSKVTPQVGLAVRALSFETAFENVTPSGSGYSLYQDMSVIYLKSEEQKTGGRPERGVAD